MRRAIGPVLAIMLTGADAPAALPEWIAGAWSQRFDDRWTEEYWTPARGHIMIGAGLSGRGENVRNWEHMRIEQSSDGKLTFYGSPKAAPPVAFAATSVTATEIVFTNASHDYPQRVRYRRSGEELHAEVSMADGSRAERWTYRRLVN